MSVRHLLAVAGLSGLLAACGATELALTPPAAPAPAPIEHEAFPAFGFVHAVDAGEFPATITFDDAEWFTGDEAAAAARADGHDVPEGGLANGTYVRNGAPNHVTYPMAGNVVITVTDAAGNEAVLTPRRWQQRILQQATGEGAFFEPYHFTFVEGTIVEVRSSRYRPDS